MHSSWRSSSASGMALAHEKHCSVLVQRSLDMNKVVYLCFIDYQKAFDYVRHGKVLETLTRVGIDDSNLRAILASNCSCPIWKTKTNQVPIKRSLRQGCVLSPTLFNLYAEGIIIEVLEEATEDILINGKRFNNVWYAYDTVLIALSSEELQSLLNKANEASRN